VGLGLSGPEADAFMTAWEPTFFSVESSAVTFFNPEYSDGLFLIYALPEAVYDEYLPLTLKPEPDGRVRVGVVYQQVETQSCSPAQALKDGACVCPDPDLSCTPWCDPPGPDCNKGTYNDITCTCDPVETDW
jgi:hypothetical protein